MPKINFDEARAANDFKKLNCFYPEVTGIDDGMEILKDAPVGAYIFNLVTRLNDDREKLLIITAKGEENIRDLHLTAYSEHHIKIDHLTNAQIIDQIEHHIESNKNLYRYNLAKVNLATARAAGEGGYKKLSCFNPEATNIDDGMEILKDAPPGSYVITLVTQLKHEMQLKQERFLIITAKDKKAEDLGLTAYSEHHIKIDHLANDQIIDQIEHHIESNKELYRYDLDKVNLATARAAGEGGYKKLSCFNPEATDIDDGMEILKDAPLGSYVITLVTQLKRVIPLKHEKFFVITAKGKEITAKAEEEGEEDVSLTAYSEHYIKIDHLTNDQIIDQIEQHIKSNRTVYQTPFHLPQSALATNTPPASLSTFSFLVSSNKGAKIGKNKETKGTKRRNAASYTKRKHIS